METPTLEAQNLVKRYGELVALDGVDLTASAGEILGLLGPNGAGKTTAIRVLTTILAPTRGNFSVAGIPDSRPSQIRAQIGVLPESAGYPEQQTGESFLSYHAQLFGRSRADARSLAASLLGEVGLAESASRRIVAYSRGMRQRLGIARALINEPAVVFLDEPTLGLDPAGQRQVLRLVEGIAADRGATVVLSTHFLAEVEEICSRVIILNRGRVVAEGTVAEVAGQVAGPRRGRIRVPADQVDRAIDVLGSTPAVASAQRLAGQPDWLTATLRDGPAATESDMNEVIEALLAAEIPLRGFEREGARLSDAFLSVTEED